MSKLGTSKRPLVLRVQNLVRAEEIADRCDKMNVKFVLGIEEDKPEDLRDLERCFGRDPKKLVASIG